MIKPITFLFVITCLSACIQLPKTIEYDQSISFTEIDGYKFHTEIFGQKEDSVVIVVHGGPGADHRYLLPLNVMDTNHRVVFYDQRGSGLSPRVNKEQLTLDQSIGDLHSMVKYFGKGQKVKLIGHSWGGMLVAGYLTRHPNNVSHAVLVEPGMLYRESAQSFVSMMKESQSISNVITLIRHLTAYPFVSKYDGHEGYDYVMTKLLNQSNPGGIYQCNGESLPENTFTRAGYDAFDNMLKPIIDDPTLFSVDLTDGINLYSEKLLMISSECSAFGFDFQEQYHLSKLPNQTIHIKANNMGHNMLTLNPEWSVDTISDFFKSH